MVLLNHTAEGAQHAMAVNHSTAATVLVAIDISKHRHEVLIEIPGKKRRCRMTIMNTLEDFQRLSAALISYDLPVRIGLEAPGNYPPPLAHHLGQAGFDLKLISSVGLARTREAYRHLSPSGQLERLIFRVLDALGARNEDIVDQAHAVDPGGLICRDPD